MAYIPGCSADVFISYAHRDNVDGWVTKLKNKLVEKLTAFLAGRAEVWFDDRIQPGVYFKEEIQQRLKDTPIFVAVVSPSYLDSEFSIVNELDWFQNQGGSEIIQLLKVPLEKFTVAPNAALKLPPRTPPPLKLSVPSVTETDPLLYIGSEKEVVPVLAAFCTVPAFTK